MGEIIKLMRKLQVKNATLQANQPKRRVKNDVPKQMVPYETEISMLGRKYSHMVEPWITTAALFDRPRPTLAADSVHRYDSELSIQHGLIAEIYDFIPEKLHRIMANHSYFGTLVSCSLCHLNCRAIIFFADSEKGQQCPRTSRQAPS